MGDIMTNHDLIQRLDAAMKAITRPDLGSSILAPQKRDTFVRAISEATRVLEEARQLDMNSHTREIDRVGFTQRILGPAQENEEPSETKKPDFHTNKLESVEAIAVVGLTDSTLEDNIEREDFENTLLQLIGERAGVDLEELFLNGDKDSGDPFLALTDGWMKKAANQVSGGGADPGFDPTDVENMFQTMLEAVPKKYLRNRSEWRFYCHWDIEDDYREKLKNRGTALGDQAQTTAQPLAYKGIPVVEVANMKPGSCLLVPPSNLVYGIYRTVRIEPDRIPKARRTDFVVTLRADCHFEDENAAVAATGYTGA